MVITHHPDFVFPACVVAAEIFFAVTFSDPKSTSAAEVDFFDCEVAQKVSHLLQTFHAYSLGHFGRGKCRAPVVVFVKDCVTYVGTWRQNVERSVAQQANAL